MIDPAHYGLVELVLVGAMALGFGIWQLWSVNREIARDSKQRPRHSVGQHREDDGRGEPVE
ncbi:hypothetical protein FBR43_09445 [Sphingomonas baiyangensis]|uniref:Uncharacterized protein n=1 Tax=Sphingomonas baiyangensis TaxID=2572576 RepID=A0A4U1L258_9SPHN|nr:hypothetical protein FBR43_09445 [Sphingomonas baiyangensis]